MRPALALALVAACAHAPVGPAPGFPPPTGVRLPAGVAPVRYALELWIDPEKPKFRGAVEADLEVSIPTRVLWLNATALELDDAQVSSEGGTQTGRVIPGNASVTGLALDAPVQGRVKVRLTYRGALDGERSQGLYRRNIGGNWYVYSQFEPLDARRAFPCIDEPGFKVPWQVTLHAPAGNVALSNQPRVSEGQDGAWHTVRFSPTPPLPSYLVALVVGPFDVVDAGTAGDYGTPLRFVVPSGHAPDLAYARRVTPRILSLLERYFGQRMPFEKLDIVAVADSGGMEHPGLLALSEAVTLIRPEDETLLRQQAYADLTAHELAHYWFGDLVTTAWWDDTWLNESLAQWMDAKIVDQLEPTWHYGYDRLLGGLAAESADALAAATPVRHAIETEDDVAHAFDGLITYEKGAALVGMFERWVGPEKFGEFLRDFLLRHAGRSATAADFAKAFSEHANPALTDAWTSFLDHPGVPRVSARQVCEMGARLELTQERYAPFGSGGLAPSIWGIPVCVRYGVSGKVHRQCTLLSAPSGTLALEGGCPDWWLLNADGAGYYRSSYTREQLASVVRVLPTLDVRDRLRLAKDVEAEVDRGALGVGDGLALLPAYAQDPSHHVLQVSYALMGRVVMREMSEASRARYRRFLRATFGTRARALGWEAKPKEPAEDGLVRWMVVPSVAEAEDPVLQHDARGVADRWLDGKQKLPLETVGAVLSAAARTGDAAFFDRLVSAARAERDRDRKVAIYGATGQFLDPKQLERALQLSVDPALEPNESFAIVTNALGDYRTEEQLWRFMTGHFDALAARMTSESAGQFLGWVATACSESRLAEAKAFFEPRAGKYQDGTRRLSQALEEGHLCVAAWAHDKDGIEQFLSRY